MRHYKAVFACALSLMTAMALFAQQDVDLGKTVKVNIPSASQDIDAIAKQKKISYSCVIAVKGKNQTSSMKTIANALRRLNSVKGALMVTLDLSSVSNIEEIPSGAFQDVPNLQGVILPKGLKAVGKNAFAGCAALNSVTLYAGLASIERGAFMGCTSLKSIEIPQGVTSIGIEAFSGCRNLQTVETAQETTTIGQGAFAGCDNLKTISLSANLSSIGYGAFEGCSKIETVSYGGSNTQWEKFYDTPDFADGNGALLSAKIVCQDGAYKDGPFGLRMGMTLTQVKAACLGDPVLDESSSSIYWIQPKRTNPMFQEYCVYISPTEGLFKIGANSNSASVAEVKAALQAIYGKCALTEDESQYVWKEKSTGGSLSNYLEGIWLGDYEGSVSRGDMGKQRPWITYEFKNAYRAKRSGL